MRFLKKEIVKINKDQDQEEAATDVDGKSKKHRTRFMWRSITLRLLWIVRTLECQLVIQASEDARHRKYGNTTSQDRRKGTTGSHKTSTSAIKATAKGAAISRSTVGEFRHNVEDCPHPSNELKARAAHGH
jgi:hypothetical protein